MTSRRGLIRISVLALLGISCAGRSVAEKAGEGAGRDLTPDQFEARAKEAGVVVLDVRTPGEVAAGRIKDSVAINFNDKDFEVKAGKLDKGKTYLVYCAVGGRSAKACGKMEGLGIGKVYNLAGGIKAWEKAGKAVER